MNKLKDLEDDGFNVKYTGVEELEFSYIWVPMPKIKKEQEETEESEEEDFEFVELVEEDENKEGWGLPQGVRIKLTLHDPTAEEQEVTFTTTVAFRGPTTPYDEHKIGATGELE